MTGKLAKPHEVAEYLGVSRATLANWRHRHYGPRWIAVGQQARYRWSDVEEWLTAEAEKCPVVSGDAA